MSVQKRPKLADLACKYLKTLSLQKSSSEHTSTSYANDLSQFLRPSGVQKILYTSGTLGPSFQIMWSKNSAGDSSAPTIEDEILRLIRESQEAWKDLAPSSRARKVACVRGFVKWLYAQKICSEDLTHRLVAPKSLAKVAAFSFCG